MNDRARLSRRNFLSGAALGAVAVAGMPLLASCTSTASNGAAAGAAVALPRYIPITKGPAPDLPGNGNVQPVFFAAPARSELFTSVGSRPGKGGTFSAFVVTYSSPPPSPNTYLEFINRKVGATLAPQIVPSDSYPTKMATTLAGGDIPDIVEFVISAMPTRYPSVLKSQFADLSQHLSGDAIKAYPNLANIPTAAWVPCRVNGRIYGVPLHRAAFGQVLLVRSDVVEKVTGDKRAPKNKADFTALCKDVTSAKENRYALAGVSNGNGAGADWGYAFLGSLFGVPNNWKLSKGRFTHMYETDAWLEMLSYIRQLNAAGYYHPDTPTINVAQGKTYLKNGTVVMRCDGPSALLDPTIPHEDVIEGMVPFSASGGKGINYQGPSMFSFSAISKTQTGKVKELLAILNYLAAPYGSTEYFDMQYGEKGVHYTEASDGTIALTSAGTAMIGATNLARLTAGPQVLTSAVPIDAQLRALHTWEKATAPMLLEDPTTGLYSQTATQAAGATATLNTAFTEYILGRNNLASVKGAVASWTAGVGNAMRSEYHAELKKAG